MHEYHATFLASLALCKAESRIGATEAKAVGQSDIDCCILSFVGDIVTVELVGLGLEVDGWRHDILMINSYQTTR